MENFRDKQVLYLFKVIFNNIYELKKLFIAYGIFQKRKDIHR
jgi:hypothetical protein